MNTLFIISLILSWPVSGLAMLCFVERREPFVEHSSSRTIVWLITACCLGYVLWLVAAGAVLTYCPWNKLFQPISFKKTASNGVSVSLLKYRKVKKMYEKRHKLYAVRILRELDKKRASLMEYKEAVEEWAKRDNWENPQ